jgi:hypothetical protein
MENRPFQKNNPKRHKLIKPLHETKTENLVPEGLLAEKPAKKSVNLLRMKPADVESYIKDIAHLRKCLLTAMKLELSTIPPYLCALYTIREGSSVQASALIRSVVVEEMLHMVLVANILNAITDPKAFAGKKLFDVKEIIANYPTPLPGDIVPLMPDGEPPFEVNLRKFSKEAIGEFTTIERPSDPNDPLTGPNTFDSIGQFYEAIRHGIDRLNRETKGGIFIGDPKRQVTPEHYYGSGGKIVPVYTYEDAEMAIEEIVGQGEGIDGTISASEPLFGEGIEYAHYFKFQEINYGRLYSANDTNFRMPVKSIPTGQAFDVSWSAVHNMKENPRMKDYEGNPALLEKAKDFNRTYVQLLNNINDAVSGDPGLLVKGITLMYDLKYKALELLNIPLSNGEYAGPTFEYVEL